MAEPRKQSPRPPDPPLGFYFKVAFIDASSRFDGELSFQSVSGLTAEVVTEAYKEGGQNWFDYKLPLKTQYPDLALKRGLWLPESEIKGLQKWFVDTMQSLKVSPVDLNIMLLNPSDSIVMNWNVKNAWPKKWTISDFNAEENQVVIETMEFHYHYFTVGAGAVKAG